MNWIDATSYSRRERGSVEPRTWEFVSGGIRVTVSRITGREGWFATCYDVPRVKRVEVGNVLVEAKKRAIGLVVERVTELHHTVSAWEAAQ